MNNKKGITLMEVVLSIAVIAILAGLSLPVAIRMLTKNDLDIATVTTAQTMRRAQTLSQSVDGDSNWGVKVQTSSITLFKGTSFATRDSNFDEDFSFPTSITPSGVTEAVFTKLFGDPQTTGTITLSTGNDSSNIVINGKGMVSY